MGFKLFQKGSHMSLGLPEDEVSVAKTCITLGMGVRKFLKEDFVEVYLDREENRVGLKPTKSSLTGFKIFGKKETKTTSIVGSFIKLLPKGRYKTKIEDGLIVFKVPEIAKRKQDE